MSISSLFSAGSNALSSILGGGATDAATTAQFENNAEEMSNNSTEQAGQTDASAAATHAATAEMKQNASDRNFERNMQDAMIAERKADAESMKAAFG